MKIKFPEDQVVSKGDINHNLNSNQTKQKPPVNNKGSHSKGFFCLLSHIYIYIYLKKQTKAYILEILKFTFTLTHLLSFVLLNVSREKGMMTRVLIAT